jgi:hypothetical protein
MATSIVWRRRNFVLSSKEREKRFLFSLFYTRANFKGSKKRKNSQKNFPASERFPLRKQNEEERLNLAFAALPHLLFR